MRSSHSKSALSRALFSAIKRAIVFPYHCLVVGIKLPLGEVPTAHTIEYPSSRCLIYQSTGLNEVTMEAEAEQNKRNQHWPFALLKSLQWKVGMTPWSTGGGDRYHGTLEVHYQRKEQTASSSRKFSFRRFMSSGVQKPSEEPLELKSGVRRSLFPPSSPAWARWAGARTFWCLALIYLFDEK